MINRTGASIIVMMSRVGVEDFMVKHRRVVAIVLQSSKGDWASSLFSSIDSTVKGYNQSSFLDLVHDVLFSRILILVVQTLCPNIVSKLGGPLSMVGVLS